MSSILILDPYCGVKFVVHVYYTGIGVTKYSSLKFMSMLVLERKKVQVCYSCLCWYWKDNAIFKVFFSVFLFCFLFLFLNSCLCWYWKDNVVFKFVFYDGNLMMMKLFFFNYRYSIEKQLVSYANLQTQKLQNIGPT